MIDALLQWPFTPFAVAAACALFFYQANGGFRKNAPPGEELPDKSKLSQLTFMVFVMSLAVILSVRFLAEVGEGGGAPNKPGKPGKPSGATGGSRSFAGGGSSAFYGGYIDQIRGNAYSGPAPF
jgi:uncharacterized membrane protein YgcG